MHRLGIQAMPSFSLKNWYGHGRTGRTIAAGSVSAQQIAPVGRLWDNLAPRALPFLVLDYFQYANVEGRPGDLGRVVIQCNVV